MIVLLDKALSGRVNMEYSSEYEGEDRTYFQWDDRFLIDRLGIGASGQRPIHHEQNHRYTYERASRFSQERGKGRRTISHLRSRPDRTAKGNFTVGPASVEVSRLADLRFPGVSDFQGPRLDQLRLAQKTYREDGNQTR